MKAILLNSADKLSGVHGSARTVVRKDGTAFTATSAGVFPDISLDQELGAGHLNAKSAYDNFAPGEYGPGSVPAVGWDYGSIGTGTTQQYAIDQPVSGWVAVTLAWDRRVVKTSDGPYLVGDQFFTYDSTDPDGLNSVMTNLDVYLTRISDGTRVDASETVDDNLEHIFFDVGGSAANYKIEVEHKGVGPTASQSYALAWWAGELTSTPGDFDTDGDVDQDDLGDWKSGFGPTYDGADFLAWQRNYGTGGGNLTASEMLNQVSQIDFDPEQGVNSESESSPLPIDNPLDVTGMQAVYDPITGNVEFEGLTNIHGIGIMSNGEVDLNPTGANSAGGMLFANAEEIGWLFTSGISGGAFDGGDILEAGLSDELSNYFIGVVRMGSGKSVTPIPIVVGSASYLPNFNPFAPAVAAVPEPSALALGVLGLAVLWRPRHARSWR